jgi:hypothetical protein
MDVKFEGENVVRHLDLTTHNHMSFPGNGPPWAYKDSQAGAAIKECEKEVKNAKTACAGKKTRNSQCKDKACREAKRCLLVTYKQGKRKGRNATVGCCKGEQPHHLVEAHCFYKVGKRGSTKHRVLKAPPGKSAYNDKDAPCVCASGPRHSKEHGQYHAFQQKLEAAHHKKNKKWKYKDARNTGVKAHKAVNPQCREGCTKAQLDSYHKERCGTKENTELRTDPKAATRSAGKLNASQLRAVAREIIKVTKRTVSRAF